jgi:hypothetical protein
MGTSAKSVVVVLGLGALSAAGAAQACGEALRGPLQRVESARYEIAFRAMPSPVEAGTHFSLELAVCPRGGAAPPHAVRVDAVMPEHRHGMNYRAVVVAQGPAQYRADGLMFHMPGRWDLLFDLVTAAGTERLIATTEVE